MHSLGAQFPTHNREYVHNFPLNPIYICARAVCTVLCRSLMTVLRRVYLRFMQRINFDLPRIRRTQFLPAYPDKGKKAAKLYVRSYRAIMPANSLLIRPAFSRVLVKIGDCRATISSRGFCPSGIPPVPSVFSLPRE